MQNSSFQTLVGWVGLPLLGRFGLGKWSMAMKLDDLK
jgi:hypothetical protein